MSAASSPRRAPESAASLVSSRTCSALWSDFREPTEPSNAASAFPTNTSDKRSRARTSCLGTCMRVPGRGGPRMSRSGFRSMIDSAWAQPMAERSTRKRPETTDTPAPESRHRAMVTRTTSGRSGGHPPSGEGIGAQRLDVRPDPDPGGGSPVVLGTHPPLEQLPDGQERCGPADRPVLGELGGQFTASLLGVFEFSVEPERPLDGPAGDRVDPHGDTDLEHARALLPQRSLAPGAHRAKNRVISRVTGGSLLRLAAGFGPLTRDNAVGISQCARQDSNLQPSDP